VSKRDFDRVGVAPGATVRVTTGKGSANVPLEPDTGTPDGVAFLAFNQPGPGAADLIEVGEPVTVVRVETTR
jgi:hypothetical protein